jgi:hypothetical protein
MTVRTQTDSIIADTDAAIVIVVLPTPGKDQTNDRQKEKVSLMGAEKIACML